MIYDFIIVGGEAIGLYLGLKLAQQGRHVLILEQKQTERGQGLFGTCLVTIFLIFSLKNGLINLLNENLMVLQ